MVTTFALSKRALALIAAAILFVAGLVPILTSQTVSAGQVTSRNATISSSKSGQTGVSWQFNFTYPSTAVTQGIIFEFCTTPLGTCTHPTGLDVTAATAGVGAQSFITTPSSNTTAFAEVNASTNDCVLTGVAATETKYCVNRTETEAETAAAKSLTISAVTNPTLPGQANSYSTVYVRMSFYSNSTFTPGAGSANIIQNGTVAAAITQQLTTSGRVQERLAFCVAAIDDDDALPVDCAAFPTTTSIDLGTIDNTTAPISMTSPVEPTATNGANDFYGIAMVNTNASGGVVIGYYPESDTNVGNSDTDQLRNFRVALADCSATTTSVTDQCFINANAAGEAFVAGTERFGVQIACKDISQGSTDNLGTTPGAGTAGTVNTAYANTDQDVTPTADCESPTLGDTGVTFAWNNAGTTAPLISSTSVVEDELIKLRFGAVAAATTPTGLYRVTTTYIATPTF
jgi:hypothetical protein